MSSIIISCDRLFLVGAKKSLMRSVLKPRILFALTIPTAIQEQGTICCWR